ncbi:hypothetical protein AHiyo1_15860 [Arthrobacter sp. Hiyo1]|nr:hypothetical protein AHiyo1_15860 [Arthrobacter sp. Hiyo1]
MRAVGQPAESGFIDGFRVLALGDLGKLLGVAKEQEPLRCPAHGEGVGERELTGFVDHQQVQGSRRNGAARHGPCRAAYQAASPRSKQPLNVVLGLLVPGNGVVMLHFLGDERRIHPGLHCGVQHVLDDGMGLCNNPYLPARTHQALDNMRTNVRLARSRRALDSEI